MKKYRIIIVIVILSIIAGILYFTTKKESLFRETSVFKAIPVTAPAFIQLNSLRSIPLDNSVLNTFFNTEAIKPLSMWISKSDSIIKNSGNMDNGLRNESFIVVLGIVGENNIFPLIIKTAESNSRKKTLENFAREMYPAPENTMEEIDYSGHKIISLKSSVNNNSFYYCFTNGLFLASTKILLVEQSIRQLSAHSITENADFTQVDKTVNSGSEISWYINHRTFPDLLANLINRYSITTPNEFGETKRLNYTRSLQYFKNFASWSELDIQIDKVEIFLNGVSVVSDSAFHFLSLFSGQEPVRFQASEILPQNTSYFTSFAFSNKKVFFEKLEKHFTLSGSYYKREDKIKKIENAFRIDFKAAFQQMVKNEIIVAISDVPKETEKKTTLFILQTEGKTNAETLLNSMLSSHAQRLGIEFQELKSTYSIDNETRFTIYNFPFPSLPGIWLGKPFEIADAKFAAFYNNSLVFCNSENGLEEYLYSRVLESTLSKDSRYQQIQQNTENKGNINTYLNVSRAFNLSKEVFNADISKTLAKNEKVLEKIQGFNWQVINEKEMFFNSVFLSFQDDENIESDDIFEDAKINWKSNIGNSIVSKPAFVINPADGNNQEIVICDSKNDLQMITKEGRVRWKIALEEPLLSEIYQIDYLGNGQLQYLFNTRSKLFLLDRNGNNVGAFPVIFRSPATNGVNVFDYDNSGKYRYFVACEDKKIYAYDKQGSILSGWNFDKTDFPVTTPVQHFRVSGKDYIVFKDKSRIYIQNRKGETRVTTSAKFENSQNPLILNTSGTPKIITSDKNGTVYYLYFTGKFTEIETDKFSDNHFFTAEDLNGDGSTEFIYADGKMLTVFNEKGKELFSEKFKNSIQHPPGIYTFSSKNKKIGVVDESANRIYLYDLLGKLHDGFPLQGNSEFSIGKLSKNSDQLNLIVGSKGGNLYNYTLN